MKNMTGRGVLLMSILMASWGSLAQAREPTVQADLVQEARNSFIFVFHPQVGPERARDLAQKLSAEHGSAPRHVFVHALKGFSATLPDAAAARIARNPNVQYYERNGIAKAIGQPVSAQGKRSTVGSEPAQVVPAGVTRVGGPRDGTGRHAWVIDTGIDTGHPDLNTGPGANFAAGKNTVEDGNGHGTHVAGIIAAKNNGIDVVGVAANATVHPVRVLGNNGSGTIDGVVAGVDYVAGHAAPGDIANMSLGATGHFQSLHDVVFNTAAQGIRFAIAAGNETSDASNAEPAHVSQANIYTISAVDANDVFASFSNFGNPPIDFTAPGVSILSTSKGGGVINMSGTSMAAPHVAGLLLFGVPVKDGAALNDPDGNPDPVAHF